MKHLLLAELGPEIWETEDLFEEDVVFSACAGPLVELVHDLHVAGEVTDWFNNKETGRHGVHASLPVLPRAVVRRGFPEGH